MVRKIVAKEENRYPRNVSQTTENVVAYDTYHCHLVEVLLTARAIWTRPLSIMKGLYHM